MHLSGVETPQVDPKIGDVPLSLLSPRQADTWARQIYFPNETQRNRNRNRTVKVNLMFVSYFIPSSPFDTPNSRTTNMMNVLDCTFCYVRVCVSLLLCVFYICLVVSFVGGRVQIPKLA